MTELPLPAGLVRLLEDGMWPAADGPDMNQQQLRPLFGPNRVQRFAKGETLICLESPPFSTVAQHRARQGDGEFWDRYGALHQIEPEKALVIGDFGLGSDSAIILDYARHPTNPPVFYLRWGPNCVNSWVQGATDFDEFAAMLGLDERIL